MIVAVKYCGGCNPKYNRSAAVKKLTDSFAEEDITFTSFKENTSYDAILLIQGCERECLRDKKFSEQGRVLKAVSDEDFLYIKKELCAIRHMG